MSNVAARVRQTLNHDTRTLPTGRAVLLALAIRADEALASQRGYDYTFASDVAVDAGISTGTALKYLRESPLAVQHGSGWRVVEYLVAS